MSFGLNQNFCFYQNQIKLNAYFLQIILTYFEEKILFLFWASLILKLNISYMYFKISDYKIYTPFTIISLDKFNCELYFQAKIIFIKLSMHHLK